MEQFTIHLTIGPRSKATFRLTYEEVLKRRLTQYHIDIKVKPKQLVHHFEVESKVAVCRGTISGAGVLTLCHHGSEHWLRTHCVLSQA